MFVLPEADIAGLISRDEACEAMEQVFAAMARGDAYNFPVVREALGEGRQYGFKSGLDRAGGSLGVKAGGYFPGNADKGLINHQSSVFLFNPDTGQLEAVVGGNLLTALRTAAASSVSIRHLARKDAKVIGMIGAGHQAAFQLRSALEQRDFERVVGWNFHPEMLPRIAEVAEEAGLPFEAVSLAELGAQADVIVSITSSFDAILLDEHVRPGTHIACMGTDTKGKQEIDAAIMARAKVFTDEVAQSVSIGECQHAIEAGIVNESDILELGAVINGDHPGRQSDEDITVFDGTGVGLQDIVVAHRALAKAKESGVAIEVKY